MAPVPVPEEEEEVVVLVVVVVLVSIPGQVWRAQGSSTRQVLWHGREEFPPAGVSPAP